MTALTDSIYDAYAYDGSDTDKLIKQLNERMRATWINTLSDLARTHGCSRLAGTPKGENAKYLRSLAERDGDSISNTYNRDLRATIERIYKDNPRSNRNTYIKRLRDWEKKRSEYKVWQIALQTDSQARQYAKNQFWEHNQLTGGRFLMRGAPPICRQCMKIMGMGVLTYEFIRMNPCPIHINCVHQYEQVSPPKIACEKLWLG